MTVNPQYRYVVIRSTVNGYAIFDRKTRAIAADELSQKEARRIVKERNASPVAAPSERP